jgi:hypothetical protein
MGTCQEKTEGTTGYSLPIICYSHGTRGRFDGADESGAGIAAFET